MPRKDPSAYDLAMRYLAVVTLLVLAVTIAQPVATQGFKPEVHAGDTAWNKKDYAMKSLNR